jgi:hypothetical protein
VFYEGTRPKGAGVVQFAQVPEAETAIGENFAYKRELKLIGPAKFQNYMYGGRPLSIT